MSKELLSTELLHQNIEECIYTIRGQQVMLDSDIVLLFEADTKRLNEQMKRNKNRFPNDFCFQLNSKEFKSLKSQNATSNNVHDRFLIIDEEECYDLGTSLNHAGNKLFAITRIENKQVVKAILNEISKQ